MPYPTSSTGRSADGQAFAHYLRTGERLTRAEWLARHEVKFNPWHDRLGRFTFGPGGAGGGAHEGGGRRPVGHRPGTSTPTAARPLPGRRANPATNPGSGFRSELVRNAVAPETSTADTYFELNKRQTWLDQLRGKAGPNPAPAVAADLADFQTRLDANRALLDKRYRFADAQALELGRAGLAPLDLAAAAKKIATGQAAADDYLSVIGVMPMGGMVGKIGKAARMAATIDRHTEPLGGAYRVVRKLQPKGNHAHHLIAQRFKALPKWEAPTISMLPEDHALTASWGKHGRDSRYNALVIGRINKQGIVAALEMDARFIRRRLGNKYDAAIEQAIAYGRSIGYKAWLIRFFR